jgi:hypothetical protein
MAWGTIRNRIVFCHAAGRIIQTAPSIVSIFSLPGAVFLQILNAI